MNGTYLSAPGPEVDTCIPKHVDIHNAIEQIDSCFMNLQNLIWDLRGEKQNEVAGIPTAQDPTFVDVLNTAPSTIRDKVCNLNSLIDELSTILR